MIERNFPQHFLKVLVFATVAIFGNASIVNAQSADAIKERFDAANLAPDAVFVPYFLSYVVRYTGSIPDQTRAQTIVSNNLGLDSLSEAESHLRMMSEIRDHIERGKDDFMRNRVCPQNSVRPSGSAFYEKLDEADENSRLLGAEALDALQASMEPAVFHKFLEWMATQKKKSTLTLTDHRVKHANTDARLVQERICGFFDSINANESR